MECLWFCFKNILQADFDSVKDNLNSHYIVHPVMIPPLGDQTSCITYLRTAATKIISVLFLKTLTIWANTAANHPTTITSSVNTSVKAVFQLRVFYTCVHARKSLNPFLYYICNEQMFCWTEFNIPYDLACFSGSIC